MIRSLDMVNLLISPEFMMDNSDRIGKMDTERKSLMKTDPSMLVLG